MRQSCHEENRKMLESYQLYQKSRFDQSLEIYESILEKTTNQQLRQNLICTISVVSTTLGNYNYALEVLEHHAYHLADASHLVRLRYLSNLCFLQIIMGMYNQALQSFSVISELIRQERDYNQVSYTDFVVKMFLRVENLSQIQQPFNRQHYGNSLIQGFYMLNLAFAKYVCGQTGSEDILKYCYSLFCSFKKFELGVIALRQLLLHPLGKRDAEKYEKQLNKIISMDLIQNYDIENRDSIDCCRLIAEQIVKLCKQQKIISFKQGALRLGKNRDEQKKLVRQTKKQDKKLLWKTVLVKERRRLNQNGMIDNRQREAIGKNIELMLKQNNLIIIEEMMQTNFYKNSEAEVINLFNKVVTTLQQIARSQLKSSFLKIKGKIVRHSKGLALQQKQNRSFSSFNMKSQNLHSKSLSNLQEGQKASQKTSNNPPKKQSAQRLILNPHHSFVSLKPMENDELLFKDNQKIVQKMIKFCEYGSFLSKRNFNSEGGEYRFFRLTNSIIKWAKNPDKIQESHQFYPLKDIRSIVYGKCTPTMLKQCNQVLKEQFCFSLALRKRSLDLYCKDFEQTSNWICGLSKKMQQINPGFRGYTLGKLLWKRMFIKIKQNYTSKLRVHERKYYYETAEAIVMFGKAMQKFQK